MLSLLRNPFLLAFLISAPIISHTIGSSHSIDFVALYLATARAAWQDDPEPEVLERRQSVDGMSDSPLHDASDVSDTPQ